MRQVCLAFRVAALGGLIPLMMFGQGSTSLSITNYQFVKEQRISAFISDVTYKADLVNAGLARNAVTASVTSQTANIQVVPGQGNLHFAPVPANSRVTSLDTFTITIDRTVVADLSQLQWSFLAPVANPGPNRTAKVGDLVILDGSGSTNPSGYGSLSYNWKLVSTPPGSSTVLFWYDTVKPQFTVDVQGTYVLTLTVSNGGGSDSATVTVSTTNTPPVANAGANRTASPGTTVTLNGSGSSDVDGDPLTYSWTIFSKPSTSNATLIGANTVSPMFTVDKTGSYTIQLIVNDGKADSAPATVIITTQNTPPVANAGPNQIQSVGALVQLDGSGSTDVDGDPLTYLWSLISVPPGSNATPSNGTAVKPTFTADKAGTYVAQLIVNDGKANSTPATVQITTNTPLAPTAIAGPNQTVAHKTTVHLNGSGTDPQGLPLTFQWSLTTKPPLSTALLSSTTTQTPTFVADLPGIYVAQLIVNNGVLSSAPSLVTITTTNTPPVANPGLNQFVPTNSGVTVDGSASSDADGDPLTYAWSLMAHPNGSNATLSSLTAVSPTFFADVAGTYVVQLIVSDGFTTSTPATVTITAGAKTITLTPNPLNLSTNTPGFLTLSLGSLAGPGGQIVALDSSNGTIAAVQANITVPQGLGGVNVPITPGSGAGSTVILAAASGFTPGTATVNVAPPSISISLPASVVGLSRTLNGSLTLNSPAPQGGVTVSLTDPAGLVTFQPASVPFAAGATTGTFTLTGAANGSTTILAGAPGYITGTTNLTVAMLGAITLLSNITVGPGQSMPFPVSLVTGAPTGGVTITLASDDTSKVTISPSTVTIPQGANTPQQQPMVTGVNLGSASISATAPGFFGDTKSVQVAATLSLQPQLLTIGVNGTQNLTLTLSGAAPSTGLTVNLSSSNTGVATVPATVTIPATMSSVQVPVTAIAVGNATIHASALPALADTTAGVNVVNVGVIGLPPITSVGLGQTVPFPITLPSPAPAGGVTVSLASSDTSKITISSASVNIGAGQTTPAAQPTITGVSLGSANISASATGYTAANKSLQVTAALTFEQSNVSVGGGATQNFLLDLSAPAPAGGLTVALSSSNSSVASVPPTVNFAANATTVNVPVTGGSAGSATIQATATNVSGGSLNVTVQATGGINVPASLSTQLGQTVPLTVALSAASTSPVTVTLASSDTSKVSVSPTTVTIAPGQTSPTNQPQVTGVNVGSVTVSATAPGYTAGSTTVQVGASISFTPPSLTISGGGTQNLTLTLSANAPTGGLTVSLSSSNTGVATVSPTATFAQGTNTVSVPVTAVNPGSAVIHASNLPNIADTTANVTVQGSITLPASVSVAPGQQAPLSVSLGAPAPAGGVTLTLVSSDTTKVQLVSGTVFIAQGQTTPNAQPAINGIDFGDSNITVSGNGVGSASTVAHVTGSASFFPSSLTLTAGANAQSLSLSLSSNAPSGVTFTLHSSNTSVATVPASITVPPNQNNVSVSVTPVGQGTATITASTSTPNIANTTANITVNAPGTITLPSTLSVGLGKSAPLTVSLPSPAASTVTINLSSSDPSKLTISPATVNIAAGQTTPAAQPQVTGLDIGGVTITASATGFQSATTAAQVTATISFNPPSLTIVGNSGNQFVISLSGAAPATGIVLNLSSSNPAVATVPAQQTFFPDGSSFSTLVIPVTVVGAGTTTIHAGVSPFIPDTTAGVTVIGTGSIGLPANTVLAPNQSAPFAITLGTPAPTGGVTVTLASSDTTKVTIAPAQVTIAQGQTTPASQPIVTGLNYGTATINATASGYAPANAPVQVTTTMSFASPTVTINGLITQNVALNLSSAAPAGGLTVNLSSGNTGVATVPSSVTFAGGAATLNVPITALAAGSASITAVAAAPGINNAATNVTVASGGSIGLPPSGALGLGQTVPFPVTLTSPAPADLTVNLVSSDPTRAVLSTPSVGISAGQTTPAAQPMVTGLNLGTAVITATSPGLTSGTSTIQVTAGVVLSPPVLNITGTGTTQNLTLTLTSAAPSGGLTITLSSSDTSVATVPTSAVIAGGANSVQVPVTAIAAGSATIHASALPSIPDTTATVNVQGGISLANNVTVPPGQLAPLALTLGTPAPAGGLTITLTSSDTTKVDLVSNSVFVSAGQTTPSATPTVIGVNFGSATISATAPGYTSGTTTVQVNGTATFFPASIGLVAGTGAQNVSLALSAPAPANVTFSLTSSNTSVATVPSLATIPVNQNNVTVPVTGTGPGSAIITATTVTPNIPNAPLNVTVTAPGVITLPSTLNVGLSTAVDIPITLGTPAPAGGLTVTLSSSDNNKLSISPVSVNIAAGQTAPANQPKATGLDIGAITITASAPGYANATSQAQVTATVTYAPTSLSEVAGDTQNFTLTLSGSAPANGITVVVNSSSPANATVPQQVTFLPGTGNSTVTLPVTGVAAGTAVIHVNALPFIPDSTANVTILSPGVIGLPTNLSVGPTQTAPFPVTLGSPAGAGGVTVALTSADTTKLTLSTPTVTIAAGQTTPASQPTVTGVDYGTVSVSATAPGFSNASTNVQVTATMTFAVPAVTITGITTQNVALNLSAPAPAGGLTVNLNSSNTSVATVPASVSFPANATTVNVPVTSVAVGPTTITATAVAPNIANATTNITVQNAGGITLPASTALTLGQTAAFAISLPQAASSDTVVSLSSSDTTKVTISTASVTILTGQTTPAAQPTVTGVNLGSANITATAPGFNNSTSPVQVSATLSYTPNSLTITGTGPQNVTLNLSAPAPASGVTVNVSSSNTSVATVPSTVTFTSGHNTATLVVTAVAAGSAVIHASKTPDIADATLNVTVSAPATVTLPSNLTVGMGKSTAFAVSLASPASADLTIALTSSDTTKLTISPASITILAGQTTPANQPAVSGVSTGSASISASGTGITPASTTVQVNATISFAQPSLTVTGVTTQNAVLNLSGAAPAGGLTINLSSDTPSVATVPATVNFAAGATTVNVPVTGVSVGTATITASTAAPNIPSTTESITVTSPGAISLPSSTNVNLGQTATFAVTLPQPAPANVTVSLSSSNTSNVTISPASVTINSGQTTPATQPTVTGVKLGSATITATAPGYGNGTGAVQVNATVSFTPNTATIAGFTTQNLTLTLSSAAPAGGVTINLSSSTPATATVPATVSFSTGATTVNVPVTGLAFGTTVIHASALPNIPDATATVTVASAGAIGVPANTSVSLGQSGTFAITLPSPAPSPVTVTVTSSDQTKVAVSNGPFVIATGATAPTTQPQLTGVNVGTVTVTASAPGYTSGTGAAQSNATVSFAQSAVTISGSVTQNVQLNLSAPAPSGGLTVNLSSATPAVATVPATANFSAGATSTQVPVTTLTPGSAVVHASLTPFIPDAITTITVQSAGNVVVPANSTVALGGTSPLSVTLSAPAPTALTVTLTSSDTTTVTISPATVSIAQGATSPASQPTITGVNIGTANITAGAAGYSAGISAVQVSATATFTPATSTITGLNTKNLTLTLSAPAPTATTIHLSSSDTTVLTVPATVSFAANTTTVNVPVTGVALGAAVIHANATPFIADTTANVTVVSAGPIGLPSGVIAGLGASSPFAVTLPLAAPAGGVTVTLSSSDTTKVTVTPATVSIAAGQTTPATQPAVNGANIGSATISASAPGYTSSSQNVTVGATVAWPASPTLTALGTANVTLTLSGPAPAGGLSVNLSSSNTLVASVPATATFTAGSTTSLVPVTALSEGTTTLHASGTNIPDSTATLTVALATSGILTVSSVSVGANLQAQIQVALSTPVSGLPLNVTITSSDGNKLVLGSLIVQGKTSMMLQFPVGSSSGIAYAQALAGSGAVTVTASAPGYTSGSGTVTLTPSGFVITGPAGTVGVPSFPTNVGNTTTLTVSAARLDNAFNFVEIQGIRGGFNTPVPLSSSITSVGNISPATLNFTPADTAYTTTFTALAVGTTLVSAGVPVGFSTPGGGANGITANVAPGGVTAPNVTVGKNLELNAQVTLTGAPSVPTVVTLVSSDATRLRFGTSPTDPGAGTIPIPGCVPPVPDPNNVCKIVKVGAGQNHSPDIYFQALDSSGSVTYTATVGSLGTGTGTVSFQPSGIVLLGPSGLGATFSTTSASTPTTLTVESAMLDAQRNFSQLQAVAPTGQVTVNLTSSNNAVGTISPTQVTIPGGSAGVSASFQPVGPGVTTISTDVPAGFTANALSSVGATVSTAGIAITQGVSIGKFLQIQGNFALGAAAPNGGLVVTLTSNNSNLVLLSTSPTAAGQQSITITLAGGQTSGSYFIQSLASSGTTTYTVSAPGFASSTGGITLTPSGVVVGDGINPGGTILGNTVVVSMAQLDPATNGFVQIQQLAGGRPSVSILMSTTVSGATITSPVIIAPGTDSASATLTGSGFGSVTATTPPGFTDSDFLTAQIFF